MYIELDQDRAAEQKRRQIDEGVLSFDASSVLIRTIAKLTDVLNADIKIISGITLLSAEDESRKYAQGLNKTLAEIDFAQRRYLERLDAAKIVGAISNEDYQRAKINFLPPFEEVRRKARITNRPSQKGQINAVLMIEK